MSCTSTESNVVHVARTQGESLRLTVDLGAAEGEVDISGWSWTAEVKQLGVTVLSMTVLSMDMAKGVVEVSLSGEQTAAMMPGDYDWSLVATDTEDDTRTLVVGKLRVRP